MALLQRPRNVQQPCGGAPRAPEEPFASARVRLQPAVLLELIDVHVRSKASEETKDRVVVATLLGSVAESGVIDVASCFINALGKEKLVEAHHEGMCEAKHLLNPRDRIVGWAVTRRTVSAINHWISDWACRDRARSRFSLSQDLPQPVQVCVDPESRTLQAFVRAGVVYHPVPCEVATATLDPASALLIRACLEREAPATVVDIERQSFVTAISRLTNFVALAKAYTEEVLAERARPDPRVGRALLKSARAISDSASDGFTRCDEVAAEDCTLRQLAKLGMLQLSLAEKLSTMPP